MHNFLSLADVFPVETGSWGGTCTTAKKLLFVISKILKEINNFIQQGCIKCIELSVYQRIRNKYVLWLAQKYEAAQFDNIKKCFLSSKSAY